MECQCYDKSYEDACTLYVQIQFKRPVSCNHIRIRPLFKTEVSSRGLGETNDKLPFTYICVTLHFQMVVENKEFRK